MPRDNVAALRKSDGNPLDNDPIAQYVRFDDCWIIIRSKVDDFSQWKDHHPGGPFVARMYAGRDAATEFGDYHSKLAEKHMAYFCVGNLV